MIFHDLSKDAYSNYILTRRRLDFYNTGMRPGSESSETLTLAYRLATLPIARFSVHLRAVDTLFLPPYKGSTIRGAFGSTFRRVICIRKNLSSCTECMLRTTCAYGCIFETRGEEGSSVLEAPRP